MNVRQFPAAIAPEPGGMTASGGIADWPAIVLLTGQCEKCHLHRPEMPLDDMHLQILTLVKVVCLLQKYKLVEDDFASPLLTQAPK